MGDWNERVESKNSILITIYFFFLLLIDCEGLQVNVPVEDVKC